MEMTRVSECFFFNDLIDCGRRTGMRRVNVSIILNFRPVS